MTSPGYIYVLVGDETGRVKIGFSQNPAQRIRAVAGGVPEPVTHVCSIPADRFQELDLHQRLRPVRVKGEWYRSLTAVQRTLAGLLSDALDPRGIA